jgi:hypothetical protein
VRDLDTIVPGTDSEATLIIKDRRVEVRIQKTRRSLAAERCNLLQAFAIEVIFLFKPLAENLARIVDGRTERRDSSTLSSITAARDLSCVDVRE